MAKIVKRIYNKAKKIKAANPRAAVLSTCEHCDEPHHEHIKGVGNSHRFHQTSLNKHPFCNTRFSMNNNDVVAYCSDKPYWKKLRKQKIKLGTLKPHRKIV